MLDTAPLFTFNLQQLASVLTDRVPRHIAIIPDGNRRWAKKQMAGFQTGHQAGADNLIEIVKAAKQLGVKVMTFYLFSTENWTRPQEEIAALMWLLKDFLTTQCREMIAHGVRLGTIGNLTPLSLDVHQVIEETKEATSHCHDIELVLALNYGGRDDITRAMRRLLNDYEGGKFDKEQVTEKLIAGYLDTNPWGDPDLLIRTSGEMRISNFLLWQLSYTEIYIVDVLWPDFKPENLLDAVLEFQKRERRLGGNSSCSKL